MKALTFMLQGQALGVPIEPVREIIGVGEVTPVPMMPSFLFGVMNLRGSVLPVIDLAGRLGLGRAVVGERSCILMVECPTEEGDLLVGILVDAVHDVLIVDDDEVAQPPSFGADVPSAFLHGMLQRSGRALKLLALDRVLSMAELEGAVDEPVAEAA